VSSDYRPGALEHFEAFEEVLPVPVDHALAQQRGEIILAVAGDVGRRDEPLGLSFQIYAMSRPSTSNATITPPAST